MVFHFLNNQKGQNYGNLSSNLLGNENEVKQSLSSLEEMKKAIREYDVVLDKSSTQATNKFNKAMEHISSVLGKAKDDWANYSSVPKAAQQELEKAVKQLGNLNNLDLDDKKLRGKLESAMVALFLDPVEYDCQQLRAAMKGAGTDEDSLIEIIASRPNWLLKKIKVNN